MAAVGVKKRRKIVDRISHRDMFGDPNVPDDVVICDDCGWEFLSVPNKRKFCYSRCPNCRSRRTYEAMVPGESIALFTSWLAEINIGRYDDGRIKYRLYDESPVPFDVGSRDNFYKDEIALYHAGLSTQLAYKRLNPKINEWNHGRLGRHERGIYHGR